VDVVALVVALADPRAASVEKRQALRLDEVLAQGDMVGRVAEVLEVGLLRRRVAEHDVIVELDAVLAVVEVVVELRLAVGRALVSETEVLLDGRNARQIEAHLPAFLVRPADAAAQIPVKLESRCSPGPGEQHCRGERQHFEALVVHVIPSDFV
jgi:hypothetical protein